MTAWGITDWLAIYGAVLSTATVVAGFITRKPKLKVEVETNRLAETYTLRITNASMKPANAVKVGARFPIGDTPWHRRFLIQLTGKNWREYAWRESHLGITRGIPATIEPAHSIEFEYRADIIAISVDQKSHLVFYVEDGLGRRTYSREIKRVEYDSTSPSLRLLRRQ